MEKEIIVPVPKEDNLEADIGPKCSLKGEDVLFLRVY